jgi:Uma2 family endonuclease
MLWTREEYYRLGDLGFFDGRRVERIHGEIIEMSPIGWLHVVTKTRTADLLRAVFAGVAWVNEQGVLPTDDSDPQPDVAVIPGRIEDYQDHPSTALFVVEIADSTLDHDLTTKAELYASAGILDYWVVDVAGRRLFVHRDPISNPAGLGANAYATRPTFGANDSVAPLAASNRPVRVADLLP